MANQEALLAFSKEEKHPHHNLLINVIILTKGNWTAYATRISNNINSPVMKLYTVMLHPVKVYRRIYMMVKMASLLLAKRLLPGGYFWR